MANNITFFNSEDIDLFPISLARNPSSTKRPYARTLSEDNLRSITSNLVDSKSFVISSDMILDVNPQGATDDSYELSPFEFMLNGYYVKLRARDLPRELWASKDIYATVLVDNWNYNDGYAPKLIGTDCDTSGNPDIRTAIYNTLIDTEGNGRVFTIASDTDATEIYKLTTMTDYIEHDSTTAQGMLVFTNGDHQIDNVSAAHDANMDKFLCSFPQYMSSGNPVTVYDGSISCSEGCIEVYHEADKLLTLDSGNDVFPLINLVPTLKYSDRLLLEVAYLGNKSTKVIGTSFITEQLGGEESFYYGYTYESGQDYIDVYQQDTEGGTNYDNINFGTRLFQIKTDFSKIIVFGENAEENIYELTRESEERNTLCIFEENGVQRTLRISYGGGNLRFNLHLPESSYDDPDACTAMLSESKDLIADQIFEAHLSLDDGIAVPIKFRYTDDNVKQTFIGLDECWLRFKPDGNSTTAYFTIDGAPEVQRLTLEGNSGAFKALDGGTDWSYPVFRLTNSNQFFQIVSPTISDNDEFQSKFSCSIVDNTHIKLNLSYLDSDNGTTDVEHILSQDVNDTTVYKLIQDNPVQYSIEFNNDITDKDSTHIKGTFKFIDNRIDSLKHFGQDYEWTASLDTLEFDSRCEGFLPISFYCQPRYKDESFEDCYLNVFLYNQNDVAKEYNLVGNIVSTSAPSNTPSSTQTTVSTAAYVNKYLGIVFTDFDPSIPDSKGEYVKFVPFNNTISVNYTYSSDPYEADTYSAYSLHILTADESSKLENWNTAFSPLLEPITRYRRFVAPEVSQYKLTTRSISNIDGGEY